MINDVVKSTLTDLQIPISELINQINYQLEIRRESDVELGIVWEIFNRLTID